MKRTSSIRNKLLGYMLATVAVVLFVAMAVSIYMQNRVSRALFDELVATFLKTTSDSTATAVKDFELTLLQDRLKVSTQGQAVKYLDFARIVERMPPESGQKPSQWGGQVWANVEPFYKNEKSAEKRGDQLVGTKLTDSLTSELLEKTRNMQQVSGQNPPIERESTYGGKPIKIYAAPIVGGSKPDGNWGILEIGVTEQFLRNRQSQLFALYGIVTIVLLFAAYLLSIGVADRISKPIQSLVKLFNGMAEAGGDLTLQVTAPTGDELEDLADATNRMRGGIKDIVSRVVSTSGKVQATTKSMAQVCSSSSQSVQQISESAVSVAASTDKEVGEVKQVFAVVKEMSGVVNLAIKTAENNRRSAEEALNTISLIETTITDPVVRKGFERIKEAVQKSAHEISLVGTVTAELEKGNSMIVKRVEEILQLSQQNAKSAEQVSAGAQEETAAFEELTGISYELNKFAEELAKAVEIFKI